MDNMRPWNGYLQEPPTCPNCFVKTGNKHKEGCQFLTAMRVQAYPRILDDTGEQWESVEMRRLGKEVYELRLALETIASGRFLIDDEKDLIEQMKRYARNALEGKVNALTGK